MKENTLCQICLFYRNNQSFVGQQNPRGMSQVCILTNYQVFDAISVLNVKIIIPVPPNFYEEAELYFLPCAFLIQLCIYGLTYCTSTVQVSNSDNELVEE